jgi:hypothetical protein
MTMGMVLVAFLDRLCCVRDDDIDVCANKLGGKHG